MAFKREERRVASGEAEGAIYNDASSCVDSFFKPVSQRECTTWRIVNSTLLVGTYSNKSSEDENATDGSSTLQSARRVAGFDLDSTLITTESGNIHAVDAKDWKWWHNSVPEKLKSLHNNGYSIVIFTNQAGLEDPKKDSTILTKFKIKVAAILDALDIPLKLYAATARDDYRKPRTGMWYEMLRSYQLSGAELDLAASFLVGDAAGREGDHSDSDRNWSLNVGIGFYTPEEFFLNSMPKRFTKSDDQKMVLFVGVPGAGKQPSLSTTSPPL